MAAGSGEKTEKASQKKRKDTRKKGEVHKSTDMCSAVMLFVTFGTLKIGYEGFIRSMHSFSAAMLSDSFIVANANNVTVPSLTAYYKVILNGALPMVLPFMLVAMVGGAVAHVVQTGPMFVPEKLKPDFKKISPLSGFKRIFSSTSLVELGKAIIKIVILCYIAYSYLSGALKGFAGMIYQDVGKAFSQVLSTSFSMGILIGLALIAFSAVDVLYQWWKFEKDIRMTKQEVKEENKQLEGDPQIKAKIRQKQRKMSAQRMMKHLPDATVVVTNPDHYAVALRYDEELDKAPVVIAKGQDYLAQRIKQKAAEYNIAIVENKPVARALYAACEVGDEVPPELYQAIADILIYVYRAINA
jgi:flagellar biosynthetic protein FlhB